VKLLYLPFLLQGGVMIFDEFYFHEKRGLPAWEKWGHPLDSLTVLICFAYLLWSGGNLTTYIMLTIGSCLFITKDEFVHAGRCSRLEHWLHALLFILHPLSFLAAYLLMERGDLLIIKVQTAVIFCFMIYQIFRWSISWRVSVK
jgi:hypothetical protein